MHRLAPSHLVGLLAALPFVACGTATSALDVATETSALVTAQCDAQSSRAAVDTCFTTFEACKTAEGAVEADCRTALDTCLPEGVPHRARRGHGGGDGGCHGGGEGRPEGGRPEGGRPEGLGGLFAAPRGGHDGGVGGHGGRGRGGRGPVGIDDATVQACRATADSCIAAGTAEQTCRDAARTCIHDAFAASFATRCQELADACAASGEDCTEINARCAAGIKEPPAPGTCSDAADAGE
ncbi:MAG: hypothetical protein ABTQ32_17370 [Myxococcaceae bacterium]